MHLQNKDTRPILDKKLYIFDMDGTIYLGENTFPFAIRFIDRLRAGGKRVLFFTNNASHSTEFYIGKLAARGFAPTPEEIMTSGDVTIEYLRRHRAGKRVYLVGTDELASAFREAGICLVDESEKACDVVVSSFDTSLTYAKLEAACHYIRGGAEYLSTHPDFNCPTEDGFIPDSGAISAFVTASTGVTPTYFGKPYRSTLDMICQITGVDASDMVIFGDRLYTDIACGVNAGIDSIFVLSGEGTLADLEASPEKPTHV